MNIVAPANPDEFKIEEAVRDQEYGLFAFWGPTGCGKTKSALLFAEGLLEGTGKKVGMVDTENGRGKHYASEHKFHRIDLIAPYTPERYLGAILKFEQEGFGAVIVDSMSHEWNGEGGLDDIAQDALVRMCTKPDGSFDSAKAERLTALSWKDAKRRHKRMLIRLLQRKMHIIFCFRAEQKVKFVKTKQANGFEKTEIVDAGFLPIAEKHFLYEVTLSAMMHSDAPGVPVFTKIEAQHTSAFSDKQIDKEAGVLMAKWCRGESIADDPAQKPKKSSTTKPAETKAEKPKVDETPRTEQKVVHQPKDDGFPGDKPLTAATEGEGPFAIVTSSKGDTLRTDNIDAWVIGMVSRIEKFTAGQLAAFISFNKDHMGFVLEEGHGLKYREVEKAIEKRQKETSK